MGKQMVCLQSAHALNKQCTSFSLLSIQSKLYYCGCHFLQQILLETLLLPLTHFLECAVYKNWVNLLNLEVVHFLFKVCNIFNNMDHAFLGRVLLIWMLFSVTLHKYALRKSNVRCIVFQENLLIGMKILPIPQGIFRIKSRHFPHLQ